MTASTRIRVERIAQELQEGCCHRDPLIALSYMRTIEMARDWIADCEWADMDEDAIAELGTVSIVRGVERHYDGGWAQFLRDN